MVKEMVKDFLKLLLTSEAGDGSLLTVGSSSGSAAGPEDNSEAKLLSSCIAALQHFMQGWTRYFKLTRYVRDTRSV